MRELARVRLSIYGKVVGAKSLSHSIDLCACFPNNLFGQLGWSFAVCTPLSAGTRNLDQAWRVY